MPLLHELDVVSRVHPDPLTRELLRRAYKALYHLTQEMNKPTHEEDDSVQITEQPELPIMKATLKDRL